MAYIVLLYQISTNCIKSHPSLFKNLHAGFVIRLSCSQYMSATYKMWMPVEHLSRHSVPVLAVAQGDEKSPSGQFPERL